MILGRCSGIPRMYERCSGQSSTVATAEVRKLVWKPHILRTSCRQVNGNLRGPARGFRCKTKKIGALFNAKKMGMGSNREGCKFLQPSENENNSRVTDVILRAVEPLIGTVDRLRVQLGLQRNREARDECSTARIAAASR